MEILIILIDTDINLYEKNYTPIPAIDVIKINRVNFKITELEIFDVLSKLIKCKLPDNETHEIDISELSLGVYFIKIKSDKHEYISQYLKK